MKIFYIEDFGRGDDCATAILIAEGVEFAGGSVVIKDLRSGALSSYHDMKSFELELEEGWAVRRAETAAFKRGENDAVQDACENAPFASIGGKDCLFNMKVPDYIDATDKCEYLAGYRACCLEMYGIDWELEKGRSQQDG